MEVLILLPFFGAMVLVPLVWLIAVYNRFKQLQQHLRESWSGIEIELQRRHDLIPNLVATVEGYAKHEREVLREVMELRNQAAARHSSVGSQERDERALDVGLQRMYAVAEGYPDLKASTQFLALQQELAITEDRIAATRRFYNGNVRDLNQLCQAFPTNIVASMFDFAQGEYFNAAEGAGRVPRVV